MIDHQQFGWEYPIKQHFPQAIVRSNRDGQVISVADGDGAYVVIDDRSLQADFICPVQPGVEDPVWIDVYFFATLEERELFFTNHYSNI